MNLLQKRMATQNFITSRRYCKKTEKWIVRFTVRGTTEEAIDSDYHEAEAIARHRINVLTGYFAPRLLRASLVVKAPSAGAIGVSA